MPQKHVLITLTSMLVAALVAAGCATTVPYNPFKIPQEEFHTKIRKIALAPLEVPPTLGDTESVKVEFESLIEAKLRDAGFSTVPSQEFAEIWARNQKEVGGFFDPFTGRLDETKTKTIVEHTLRELSTRFRADVLLLSIIDIVKAKFANRTASWHGTSESLGTDAMSWLFGGGGEGTVPALSLVVSIVDRNGARLYIHGGGIQVLEKFSSVMEAYTAQITFGMKGRNFVPVPRDELFADQERNRKAVNTVLDPLVKKNKSSQGN